MSFLRILVLAVVAYFAYRYYGWPGPVGVVGTYVLLIVVLSTLNANRSRRQAHRVITQKLSDDEKAQLSATQSHQQAMHEHKAQFDPELRKLRRQ